MAESPILNQATRILKQVQTGIPADEALRGALTQDRHFTAPGERRAISRAVFTYYRWWRWLEEKESLQKQLAAALALQERFERNPASFKAEALAARAIPDWLRAEMDDIPSGWLTQIQREPALWIRPKRGLESQVATALGDCVAALLPKNLTPCPQLSALHYTGITDLYRTPGFQNGDFEIQDLASQLVGHACAPQPGETWWDACAGEGGKTMHLSDLMQNKGVLWASDRSARRLAKLKERAARAKVFNFRAAAWEGGPKPPTPAKFDGILVDAPCSGIGTWQRNPHARWTTQPKDVHELAVVQRQLLDHVVPALKPGGRLIYAVCTLARGETAALAADFSTAHPELEVIAPSAISALAGPLVLWPHELNANGMFIATWRKPK